MSDDPLDKLTPAERAAFLEWRRQRRAGATLRGPRSTELDAPQAEPNFLHPSSTPVAAAPRAELPSTFTPSSSRPDGNRIERTQTLAEQLEDQQYGLAERQREGMRKVGRELVPYYLGGALVGRLAGAVSGNVGAAAFDAGAKLPVAARMLAAKAAEGAAHGGISMTAGGAVAGAFDAVEQRDGPLDAAGRIVGNAFQGGLMGAAIGAVGGAANRLLDVYNGARLRPGSPAAAPEDPTPGQTEDPQIRGLLGRPGAAPPEPVSVEPTAPQGPAPEAPKPWARPRPEPAIERVARQQGPLDQAVGEAEARVRQARVDLAQAQGAQETLAQQDRRLGQAFVGDAELSKRLATAERELSEARRRAAGNRTTAPSADNRSWFERQNTLEAERQAAEGVAARARMPEAPSRARAPREPMGEVARRERPAELTPDVVGDRGFGSWRAAVNDATSRGQPVQERPAAYREMGVEELQQARGSGAFNPFEGRSLAVRSQPDALDALQHPQRNENQVVVQFDPDVAQAGPGGLGFAPAIPWDKVQRVWQRNESDGDHTLVYDRDRPEYDATQRQLDPAPPGVGDWQRQMPPYGEAIPRAKEHRSPQDRYYASPREPMGEPERPSLQDASNALRRYDHPMLNAIANTGFYQPGPKRQELYNRLAWQVSQGDPAKARQVVADLDRFFQAQDAEHIDRATRARAPRQEMGTPSSGEPAPAVWYHGTTARFASLGDPEGYPVWFSNGEEKARDYADGRGGRVIRAEVRPKRTLDLVHLLDMADASEDFTAEALEAKLGFALPPSERDREYPLYHFLHDPAFTKAARAAGYDSILVQEDEEDTLGVLDPSIILSQPSRPLRKRWGDGPEPYPRVRAPREEMGTPSSTRLSPGSQRLVDTLHDTPQTNAELARAMHMSAGNFSTTINALERQGLARRTKRNGQLAWVRGTRAPAPEGGKALDGPQRVAQLEQRYGNEQRVWYDGDWAPVAYDEEEGVTLLPNGEEMATCTNCARLVLDQEGPGLIVGFMDDANPTERITSDQIREEDEERHGGHDWAVVDGRYMVDMWAKAYPGTTDRVVFDLKNPDDVAEVRRLYGDPATWEAYAYPDPTSDENFSKADAAPVQQLMQASVRAPREEMGRPSSGSAEAKLDALERRVATKHQIDLLLEMQDAETIRLGHIIVPEGRRSQGVGTAAMREILAFAEREGLRVSLSPAGPEDGIGTTSRLRLVDYYQDLGFVEDEPDSDVDSDMTYTPARKRARAAREEMGAPAFRALPAVDLRTGKETLPDLGLRPTIRTISTALDRRQQSLGGMLAKGEATPAALESIAEAMVAEIQHEIATEGMDGRRSAIGWYTKKYQEMLTRLGQVFPELVQKNAKARTDARTVFTALLAMTSDGQKVKDQFNHSVELFDQYRKTGRIPLGGVFGGKSVASINGNKQRFQDLIDAHGIAGAAELLLDEDTVLNLRRKARALGVPFQDGYLEDARLPYAALVFGPKLGAFFANLMGRTGYLTMDRWWNRTMNRLRGRMADAPTRAGMARFRAMLQDAPARDEAWGAYGEILVPPRDEEEVLLQIVAHTAAYKAKGFKDGTAIEMAANTLHKALFSELSDQPDNASDRSFHIAVAARVQALLQEQGVSLSIADIQAVEWYFEKRLLSDLGSRGKDDVSYEEAADAFIAARGEGSAPGDRADAGGARTARGPARGQPARRADARGEGREEEGVNRVRQSPLDWGDSSTRPRIGGQYMMPAPGRSAIADGHTLDQADADWARARETSHARPDLKGELAPRASDLAELLRVHYLDPFREIMHLLALDQATGEILVHHRHTNDSPSYADIDAPQWTPFLKDVARVQAQGRVVRFVIAHNHPYSDAEPSMYPGDLESAAADLHKFGRRAPIHFQVVSEDNWTLFQGTPESIERFPWADGGTARVGRSLARPKAVDMAVEIERAAAEGDLVMVWMDNRLRLVGSTVLDQGQDPIDLAIDLQQASRKYATFYGALVARSMLAVDRARDLGLDRDVKWMIGDVIAALGTTAPRSARDKGDFDAEEDATIRRSRRLATPREGIGSGDAEGVGPGPDQEPREGPAAATAGRPAALGQVATRYAAEPEAFLTIPTPDGSPSGPTFHSRLEHALQGAPFPRPRPAADWRGWLSGAKNLTQKEVQYVLGRLLDEAQAAGRNVSQDEMLAHAKANRLVTDVHVAPDPEGVAARGAIVALEMERHELTKGRRDFPILEDEAALMRQEGALREKHRAALERERAKYEQYFPFGIVPGSYTELVFSGPSAQGYQSHHFGGMSAQVQPQQAFPNYLAHARVGVILDQDGRRLLYIGEIQSDLMQGIRQQQDLAPEKVGPKLAELEAQARSLDEEFRKREFEERTARAESYEHEQATPPGTTFSEEAAAAHRRALEAQRRTSAALQAVSKIDKQVEALKRKIAKRRPVGDRGDVAALKAAFEQANAEEQRAHRELNSAAARTGDRYAGGDVMLGFANAHTEAYVRLAEARTKYEAATKMLPNAALQKTQEWVGVVLRGLLKYAADQGLDGVTLDDGDAISTAVGAEGDGNLAFYRDIAPKVLFGDVAKTLGVPLAKDATSTVGLAPTSKDYPLDAKGHAVQVTDPAMLDRIEKALHDEVTFEFEVRYGDQEHTRVEEVHTADLTRALTRKDPETDELLAPATRWRMFAHELADMQDDQAERVIEELDHRMKGQSPIHRLGKPGAKATTLPAVHFDDQLRAKLSRPIAVMSPREPMGAPSSSPGRARAPRQPMGGPSSPPPAQDPTLVGAGEMYRALLLSTPVTHVANVVGTGLYQAAVVRPSEPMARAFDWLMSLASGERTKLPISRALVTAARPAVKSAAEAAALGERWDHAAPTVGVKSRAARAMVDGIFGALKAQDRLYGLGVARRSIAEQAQVIARYTAKQHGWDRAQEKKLALQLATTPSEAMLLQAFYEASVATFNNKTMGADKSAGAKTADMISSWETGPVSRFIGTALAPFRSTPGNVGARGIEMTPFGLPGIVLDDGATWVKAALRQRKSGGGGGGGQKPPRTDTPFGQDDELPSVQRRLAEKLARNWAGTFGQIALGAALWLAGVLVKRRNEWVLKVGDQTKRIGRLSPTSAGWAVGAEFMEAMSAPDATATRVMDRVGNEAFKGITRSPALETGADLKGILESPGSKVAAGFGDVATGVIPGPLKSFAKALDPQERIALGPVDRIQSNLPWLREQLPPDFGPLGDPRTKTMYERVAPLVDPTVDRAKGPGTPMTAWLDSLGVEIPETRPYKGETSERFAWRKGQMAARRRELVTKLYESKAVRALPPEEQAAFVRHKLGLGAR